MDKIKVWHYGTDGRTYHNTKTEVSADGVTWTTVFDSAVSGEYAETAAGKTTTFATRSVRYVRDWLNGSTSNTGNHWVEIEVWGRANVTYVGDYFEWIGSPNTMVKYYSLGGARIAMRAGSGTGNARLSYLFNDHLGSTTMRADGISGMKLTELRYKPWGESRYASGSTPTKHRYTGQVSEESGIGLYYYGARFYDAYIANEVLNGGGFDIKSDWGDLAVAAAQGGVAGGLIGSGVASAAGFGMVSSLVGDHATNLMTGQDYNALTTSLGAVAGGISGGLTANAEILEKAALTGLLNGAVSDSIEQTVQGQTIEVDDVLSNFAWSAGSSYLSNSMKYDLMHPSSLNPIEVAKPLSKFEASMMANTFVPVAKSFTKNIFIPFLGTCPPIHSTPQ